MLLRLKARAKPCVGAAGGDSCIHEDEALFRPALLPRLPQTETVAAPRARTLMHREGLSCRPLGRDLALSDHRVRRCRGIGVPH